MKIGSPSTLESDPSLVGRPLRGGIVTHASIVGEVASVAGVEVPRNCVGGRPIGATMGAAGAAGVEGPLLAIRGLSGRVLIYVGALSLVDRLPCAVGPSDEDIAIGDAVDSALALERYAGTIE